MIYPDVRTICYCNSIPITGVLSVASMGRSALNQTRFPTSAIVNAYSMYNNMFNVLHCNARPFCYLNFGTSSVNCFVTVDHKYALKRYDHILLEYNPKGFLSSYTES